MDAALVYKILVSSVELHDGAFVHAVAKVSVHVDCVAPVPIVTLPDTSVPTIDGAVPHEETVGAVPEVWICPLTSSKVVMVGDVPKTATPVPVSSDSTPDSCAEVVEAKTLKLSVNCAMV